MTLEEYMSALEWDGINATPEVAPSLLPEPQVVAPK